MLEEGFELKLEAGLPLDGIFISLAMRLKRTALILGGLPDGFELVET